MREFTGRAGDRGRRLRKPGAPARLVQRALLSGASGAENRRCTRRKTRELSGRHHAI